MYKQNSQRDGSLPPSYLYQKLFHYGQLYNEIFSTHTYSSDHCKVIAIYNRAKKKIVNSIPRQCCKIYMDTCPRCIKETWKGKPSSGHQPILTKEFSFWWQFNLIDFQSIPDGQFKHLMNYQYHGIKLMIYNPIVAKSSSCVAYTLMEIFTFMGPPAILQ